jgi:hypothetical protein
VIFARVACESACSKGSGPFMKKFWTPLMQEKLLGCVFAVKITVAFVLEYR